MPARPLRLACRTDISLWVAVEHGDQLGVGGQVWHSSTIDSNEPEIAWLVEDTALEKLALRLVVDIREQRDWSGPRGRGRQTPMAARAPATADLQAEAQEPTEPVPIQYGW